MQRAPSPVKRSDPARDARMAGATSAVSCVAARKLTLIARWLSPRSSWSAEPCCMANALWTSDEGKVRTCSTALCVAWPRARRRTPRLRTRGRSRFQSRVPTPATMTTGFNVPACARGRHGHRRSVAPLHSPAFKALMIGGRHRQLAGTCLRWQYGDRPTARDHTAIRLCSVTCAMSRRIIVVS
jgi:hypothetical protein